jgi:hypothetical protein
LFDLGIILVDDDKDLDYTAAFCKLNISFCLLEFASDDRNIVSSFLSADIFSVLRVLAKSPSEAILLFSFQTFSLVVCAILAISSAE